MSRRVVTLKLTDVSDVRTASIIRGMIHRPDDDDDDDDDYTALHPKRFQTSYSPP
jgi:hypothetical protein